MRARLTIDQAREMPYLDLIQTGYGLLAAYEPPEIETPSQLEARISKSLDELPDLYAWFNQCHAYFAHWSDYYYTADSGFGPRSLEYKDMKNKRDAMEKLASSAKLRYEGTSRRLTQLMGRDEESRMPRGRG
jgi:hypothetical protein